MVICCLVQLRQTDGSENDFQGGNDVAQKQVDREVALDVKTV